MTPHAIQKALRENDTTRKAIAAKLGGSEMSVSKVVRGDLISDCIMAAVALAIGKPKTEAFTDNYFGPKPRRTSKAPGHGKPLAAGGRNVNV